MPKREANGKAAVSSKKRPRLPSPPEVDKETKTFCFELELTQSTGQSCPEFSWAELVRNVKEKEAEIKGQSANPPLDPLSGEEVLKAMASRFEAKCRPTDPPDPPNKKKVEYCVDRGAGFDMKDSSVDNSDVYDEVSRAEFQAECQPVPGGFYVNSGLLDFKEVELPEDEEDCVVKKPQRLPKDIIDKVLQEIPLAVTGATSQNEKNPVGSPPRLEVKKSVNPKVYSPSTKRILNTQNVPEMDVTNMYVNHSVLPDWIFELSSYRLCSVDKFISR